MQDDTSRGGLGPRGREALIPTSGGSPFDCIRRVTPEGREFWSARDLMPLLGYDFIRRKLGLPSIDPQAVTA